MVIVTISYCVCIFERYEASQTGWPNVTNYVQTNWYWVFAHSKWYLGVSNFIAPQAFIVLSQVVLVTMSTIGYGDLYPNTDIGRFLIVVCCGFAILALVLMIIGFRSFFAPTARELQVFHRLRFSKWLERAKLSAAVVIQSFWRSCLNVKRSQETAGYSMRQFPTYLQDTNLSHKIRAFHNVRL